MQCSDFQNSCRSLKICSFEVPNFDKFFKLFQTLFSRVTFKKHFYLKFLSHFHSGRWSVLHLLYFSLPTQFWRKQTIPTHALHLMLLKFKLFTRCTCVTSRLLSFEVILISGFNTGGDLFRRLACLGFLHRLEKNYTVL